MEINVIDELRALIGAPPAGLEPLEYVVAAVILIFLLTSAYSLIAMVFRWIGGNL